MAHASRIFLGLGCLAAFSAIALGAYGSHVLQAQLQPAAWTAFSTAVDYQLYHALALCLAAILVEIAPRNRAFLAAAGLLCVGILLFSGGIFATTFGAAPSVGRIVPIGGSALMLGWLLLGVGAVLARARGATDSLT